VDIDEDALDAARRTSSIDETADTARQTGRRPPTAAGADTAFEVLGAVPDNVREQAWR
jgi:hypothetical protein